MAMNFITPRIARQGIVLPPLCSAASPTSALSAASSARSRCSCAQNVGQKRPLHRGRLAITGGHQQPVRGHASGGQAVAAQWSPRHRRSPLPVIRTATFLTKAQAVGQPDIHSEFEPVTGTWQYIVADPASAKAVIIDPVLDFDPATQTITTNTADSLLELVRDKGYRIERILETHAHADHLTAASYLQSRLSQSQGHRPLICIGKRIHKVQQLFGQRYGVPADEYQGVFDSLLDDDETFAIGGMEVTAIHLPGHTPDHLGYKVGDNVFVGDSLFHIDIGSARCDFPGGSANHLYQSGRKLLSMPESTRIWAGHDYPPQDRPEPVAFVTVREHGERNKHFGGGTTEDEYVAMRQQRDSQMAEPRLLHQSLQINIRGGRLPRPTESNQRLLHLPLKPKGLAW